MGGCVTPFFAGVCKFRRETLSPIVKNRRSADNSQDHTRPRVFYISLSSSILPDLNGFAELALESGAEFAGDSTDRPPVAFIVPIPHHRRRSSFSARVIARFAMIPLPRHVPSIEPADQSKRARQEPHDCARRSASRHRRADRAPPPPADSDTAPRSRAASRSAIAHSPPRCRAAWRYSRAAP